MSCLGTGTGLEVVTPAKLQNPTDNNAVSDSDSDDNSSSLSKIRVEKDLACNTWLVHIYMKMLKLLKELVVMLIICVAYAALIQEPPKITKSPPAFPFLSKESIVKDYYRGHIFKAVEESIDADLQFFMFYAPWDASSQEVRKEFETAALHMSEYVSFAAVNCWQPGSECRKKYSKIYSWPVLIVRTKYDKVIQYNGPKSAPYIIKFLTKLLQPYKRINSISEINDLQSQYEALVIASIDAAQGSLEFSAFFNTAVKFLERDPSGEVAFLLLPKPPHEESYLWLHMWNETLVYPSDKPLRYKLIFNWIVKHLHQVTMWVVPSGVKSQILASYIQGPTLMLFTPFNPYAESVDYYNLLKEIALEYYNCDNDISLEKKLLSIKSYRKNYKHRLKELIEKCLKTNAKSDLDFFPIITYSSSVWLNRTCLSKKTSKILEQCDVGECENLNRLKKYLEKAGNTISKYKTSMLEENIDEGPLSASNLLKRQIKYECDLLKLKQNFHRPLYSPQDSKDYNISGLGCKTNTTLTLVALDSLQYHHFAERFGVDILKQKNKTALIIVNNNDEIHHIYDGHLTDRTMREFIMNYTLRDLPRALYSSSITFKYTHVYPKPKDCADDEICVEELNSGNYLTTVMENNKVVVVFYHSKHCAFCSGNSFMYLKAARIFSSIKYIKFTRIDGDLNALPWEYTMESYPSILFFPLKHKSESRAFPQEIPVSVQNLVNFVLSNLDPTLRLHAMWTICNQTKHEVDKRKCISSLRAENLSVIENTLKEWRAADLREKRRILRKLQNLKSLHLQLVSNDSVEAQFEKLDVPTLKTIMLNVIKDQIEEWKDDI